MDDVTLRIGAPVACTDGDLGEVADLVIAPEHRRVTHVVVAPHGHHERAVLVPLTRLGGGTEGHGALSVDCTLQQAADFDEVQDTAYVRVGDPLPAGEGRAAGVQDVVTMPIESYGTFGVFPLDFEDSYLVTYDRVPAGEVEVRGRSEITSSDDKHLGHVDGVVVEGDGVITQLLLEHRHLWGARRRVTIPASAIDRIEDDGVRLAVAKAELDRLAAG